MVGAHRPLVAKNRKVAGILMWIGTIILFALPFFLFSVLAPWYLYIIIAPFLLKVCRCMALSRRTRRTGR